MFIPPSSYSWILPVHYDLKEVDAMALAGTFPSIFGLLPAIAYAIIFGLIRLIFQTILFRVRKDCVYNTLCYYFSYFLTSHLQFDV